MRRLLAVALAACGGDAPDPCAGIATGCVPLRVSATGIDRIDQLELDVLYGDRHGTTATQLAGGGAFAFPIVTAIELDPLDADPRALGVVAAGKLAGNVLATGAASGTVGPDDPLELAIELAPPGDCEPGGFYCGGDKLSGDPDTLYQCNGGGVPLARGLCAAGCIIRPTLDDQCRAVGGPCTEGGFYCGGNELDGDPQSLYRCENGLGVARQACADGCIIGPVGDDDFCR